MISRAARVWFFGLFCLVLLSPLESSASWQRVFSVTGRAFTCGFFFSELRGIIATVDGNVFYLTTDGGRTWTPANSVPFRFPGAVSEVFMTDTLRGWASIEEPPSLDHPRRQLWRTLDGGMNWTVAAITDTGNFSCVYETPNAVTVTSRSPRYNSLKSVDGGASFQPGGFNVTNGVDFVDDLRGVITGFKATPWKRTLDGGLTWQNISPAITEESWGIFAIKGTSTFFASPERDPTIRGNTGNSPVLRSTDYGATWQNMHTFPFFSTGHLDGANGKLYVQVENISVNAPYTGLYRSDDGGQSWKSVGGPTRFQDERFIVTGCNGGVVYAFDDQGGVWKTRDGGDGTVVEPNPDPAFMGLPITFSSRICATTFAEVRIANQYCDSLHILDVTFLDPNDDAVKSGAITIVNAADFPAGIEGGGEDSIKFRWDPSRYLHTDTTVSFQVRIRYFSKALFIIRDTVVTISAQAVGDEPTVSLSPTILDLQTIPFCTPTDSIFTITNDGCDTLHILSVTGSTPQHYQLYDVAGNPVSYPVLIPPGQSFTYRVLLMLTKVQQYTSTITLWVRHQGKLKDTTVALMASVTSAGAYSAPPLLDFGKVSICAPKDTFLLLGNLACDTMRLASVALMRGGEFSFPLNQAPSNILPDSLKQIFLQYAPTDLGFDFDTLILSFTTLGDPITIKIPIRGEGTSGEAMLVVAPAVDTLFDLAMTRCDSARRFDIVLSNPGCKQLRILEARIEGPGTTNLFLTMTSPPPTDLRLGAATDLSVNVVPLQVGSFTGLLRIRYQIEGEAERDTVIYYNLRVDYGKRTLAVDKDLVDFGSYRLCVVQDTTIVLRNTGCDTLDISSVNFTGATDETWSYSGKMQLAPGDTASIRYHITPASAGARTSSASISSVSDSTDPIVVTLESIIIPTDTIRLNIAPVRFPFYVGDTITIQVIPENPVDISFGLRDIAFTLYYNGDLLTLIPEATRTFPLGSDHIAGNAFANYPAKQVTQRFFVTGSPFLAFPGDVPIMEFQFYVSLTDTTNTSLEIRNIELNGNSQTFSKCVLGFTNALSDLGLALQCGDSLLREFMRKGNKFSLSANPVFPDPLTEKSGFSTTLTFELHEARGVTLYIYDAAGKAVHAMTKEGMKGVNRIKIDGRMLAAGAYSYILSDGQQYSRGRFVIER